MDTLRQKMTLDLPLAGVGYLEDISRKKGWLLVMPIERAKPVPNVHSITQVQHRTAIFR